ncbi:hypothetical protein GH714_032741 [Hevea brasiliensis]|uniref:Uncharacterized protein n=1 Tax=Hevea brasiliensis TaxID=3981 RepID=A0A6A6LVH3_HEVBR|nr:hypothetical protein GH714_032741 [Hevea brasiliensis]
MGCAQSKVDDEESVARCKDRKILMNEAVVARNAFAAGHSGYGLSLKNAGAALSDYAQDHGARNGNVNNNKKNKDLSGSRGPPNWKVGPEETPRSPPRTPENHTVPPMPESKNMAWDYFFNADNMPGPSLELKVDANRNGNTVGSVEHDAGVRFGGIENPSGGEISGVEPKTPEKPTEHLASVAKEEEEKESKTEKQIEHSKTASPDFKVVGKKVVPVPTVNLMQVLREIDVHFLKASESAEKVSKMLEATCLHYHSNFADNRGRVVWMRFLAFPFSKARKLVHLAIDVPFLPALKGNFAVRNRKALSIIRFEKWEDMLIILLELCMSSRGIGHSEAYLMVKGELIKLEYRKKAAQLNRQKMHGASAESLEKMKAAEELLLQKLEKYEKSFQEKIDKVVEAIQVVKENVAVFNNDDPPLENSSEEQDFFDETSNKKDKCIEMEQDQDFVFDLSSAREEYEEEKDKDGDDCKLELTMGNAEAKPEILAAQTFGNFPENKKDKGATNNELHQEEELKLKEKCEETREEFLSENQAFDEWYQKYMQRRTSTEETDAERGDYANSKDPVLERQFAVESLKKKMDEEVEAHQGHCLQAFQY